MDSRRLGEKSLQALPWVAGMSGASRRAPWGVREVQSPAQLHAAVEARTEEGHRVAFGLRWASFGSLSCLVHTRNGASISVPLCRCPWPRDPRMSRKEEDNPCLCSSQ